jgi:hypothetical protein
VKRYLAAKVRCKHGEIKGHKDEVKPLANAGGYYFKECMKRRNLLSFTGSRQTCCQSGHTTTILVFIGRIVAVAIE